MCIEIDVCCRFNDEIHHYKLFFDATSGLYVREKRYDCVRSLVADGLISMYLELKAPALLERLCNANYRESPYMTLNERKFKALAKDYERYVSLLKRSSISFLDLFFLGKNCSIRLIQKIYFYLNKY